MFVGIVWEPCGLAKLAPGPMEIPCEDGGGVATKDAGDGALKAPLGELAACRFPGDCVCIIEGD